MNSTGHGIMRKMQIHESGQETDFMADDRISGTETVDDDAEYITLQFDDNNEVECEILGIFDFEGKEYIALFPQDGTDDIYIYGYKELDDEEFELIDIEDDSEFEKVAAEFELLSLEEE